MSERPQYQITLDAFLGNQGISNSISNAIVGIVERANTNNEMTVLTDESLNFLGRGITGSYDLAQKIQNGLAKDPSYPFMSDVFKEISDQTDIVNSALHAGIVGGSGSMFAQYVEGLMQSGTLLRLYKGSAYTLGVGPWIQRYWLARFTPNMPDPHDAFLLERHGQISRAEYNDALLKKGWSGKWFDKFYEVWTKHPDLYLSFSMFNRGLITDTTLTTWIKSEGFSDTDVPKIKSGLYRTPTLGELIRISDFVELSSVYLGEKLKWAGYKDTDIPLLTSALIKRPLREETRKLITQYTWEYQRGRITNEALQNAFAELSLLPMETYLDLLNAEEVWTQQLINEELQTIEYRVYKKDPGFLTIANIKTAIEDLGINEEMSNALAAQYYYHYIYTP